MYCPVVRPETVRAVLSVAAKCGLSVRVFDVQSAYLEGFLEHDIEMVQPQGFHVGPKNHICKLHRSLYGLHQAGVCWFNRYREILLGSGFSQSSFDPCLFFYNQGEKTVYYCIHVDDSLAAGDDDMIDELIKRIRKVITLTEGRN